MNFTYFTWSVIEEIKDAPVNKKSSFYLYNYLKLQMPVYS